jgi:hypothetical protein
VLLGIGDNAFACHLPLEAANRAFDAFVIVNLYSCHSKTSIYLPAISRAASAPAASAASAASAPAISSASAPAVPIGFARLAAILTTFRLAHSSLLIKLLLASRKNKLLATVCAREGLIFHLVLLSSDPQLELRVA